MRHVCIKVHCQSIYRHGLQPHLARSGNYCIEEALASENYISEALYCLDVHAACGFHSSHIAAVNDELLACGKNSLLYGAIYLEPCVTAARLLLH